MKNILNRIVSGLLTLLGFGAAACSENGGNMEMYGTPTANYSLKGKVTDATAPAKGVSSLRVIFSETETPYPYLSDTVFTKPDGSYGYTSKYCHRQDKLYVLLEDVDGPANGSFKAETVELTFDAKDYKRKSGWITEIAKTGVDFTVEPEE